MLKFSLFLPVLYGVAFSHLLMAEEQKASEKALSANFKGDLYVNEERQYSVKFPEGWMREEGFMGLDVIVLAPLESKEDKFHENISVLSGKLEAPITLEEFYSENLKNLEKSLGDFKLDGSGDTDIDGQPAKWIIYTHKQDNFEAKVMQYFFLLDNQAFLITYGAPQDSFSQHKEIFENVVRSFKNTRPVSKPALLEKIDVF